MTPDRFIAAAFKQAAADKSINWKPYTASDFQKYVEELAAELARESVGEGDELDEVLNQLDSWCKAYPEDLFPEPDDADLKWLHETKRGLCDRISASMGRHMVKHMQKMADAIRKELACRSVSGDVEKQARELLADEYELAGYDCNAEAIRSGARTGDNDKWAISAIIKALAGVSEGKK